MEPHAAVGEGGEAELGKEVTWFIVDTDGPDQGDWGTWRLDGWRGPGLLRKAPT